MKFLSILAAASLALAPAIASAGSHGDSTESTANSRPISGPLGGNRLTTRKSGLFLSWLASGRLPAPHCSC